MWNYFIFAQKLEKIFSNEQTKDKKRIDQEKQMKCFNCNADMKFEGEKEISRYNDLYDTKLSFKCQECNSCAEAYVPKENHNADR